MTPAVEFALHDLVSATNRLLRAPVLAKTEKLAAEDIRAMNEAIKAIQQARKQLVAR